MRLAWYAAPDEGIYSVRGSGFDSWAIAVTVDGRVRSRPLIDHFYGSSCRRSFSLCDFRRFRCHYWSCCNVSMELLVREEAREDIKKRPPRMVCPSVRR